MGTLIWAVIGMAIIAILMFRTRYKVKVAEMEAYFIEEVMADSLKIEELEKERNYFRSEYERLCKRERLRAER